MADDKKRDDYTIEMDDRKDGHFEPPKAPYNPPQLTTSWTNHPMVPIISYCASSISMTVANKFVLLGDFNLNFFFLCLQASNRVGERGSKS